MQVTLIGAGCGESLTRRGEEAIREAEYILGAKRLLDALPPVAGKKQAAVRTEEILSLLLASGRERCVVLFSGDTGFYSGARGLLASLREKDVVVELLPGISSLQQFAAKLGRPWQDWRLVSAHGVDCDPVGEVCHGKAAFFLTSGETGPADLCRKLTQAGLGELTVYAGENLGTQTETVSRGTAAEFAQRSFAPLNVLLAEAAPLLPRRVPGIPDEEFIRAAVPMTKQLVRAAVLAKLAIGPEDVCWDIGAGTGSVSVELALQAKAVYAVEEKPEACTLIEENREKFRAWKLSLVQGRAPEALASLPRPDAVFVGGSGGELKEILTLALSANPEVRICVSAIALETLAAAQRSMAELGLQAEVSQVAVSRSKAVGGLSLLMGENPVFLITGKRP